MLTDFQNVFTGRFTSQYVTKSSLAILPNLKCDAALLKHQHRKLAKIWCMHRYQRHITR